jgi:hypothetical protein
MDAPVDHGTQRRDARISPLCRLVTLLQDAARAARKIT